MYKINNYDNDLLFVCFMIEKIGRSTLNKRKDIVNYLGEKNLMDLYKFANVMHCENPDAVEFEFIEECKIPKGSFDNISSCKFKIPWESTMGKIYMRLIMNTLSVECTWKDYESNPNPGLIIDNIIHIYNSWISEAIDDYNNTLFTESTEYIYECYIANDIIG